MSDLQQRLLWIGLFFVLMPLIIWFVGESLRNPDAPSGPTPELRSSDVISPAQANMYNHYPEAMTLAEIHPDAKPRRLANQAQNRAYPGAPPTIPHPVEDEQHIADDCLVCHRNGGYAPIYKRYAPVTPHPDFSNCRQCHVPQRTQQDFRPTHWQAAAYPKLNQRMTPTSPPVIPHRIQLREHCQSCHVGPGALAEIKVSHPHRTNCQQCHVVQINGVVFPETVSQP